MERTNRAKQFMPFDALKGFREALAEKERLIVPKRELSEEASEELNIKLYGIQKGDVITVDYFEDGEYMSIIGTALKIDKINRVIEIRNKKIPFDNISHLQENIFEIPSEVWYNKIVK